MKLKSLFNLKTIIMIFSLLILCFFMMNAKCEAEVTVELQGGVITGTLVDGAQTVIDPTTKEVTVVAMDAVTVTLYDGSPDSDNPGSVVALMGVDKDLGPATATTGADGTFTISDMAAGWYDIKLEATGKSTVWIRNIYIYLGVTYNVPTQLMMDSVGDTEFIVVLSWVSDDDLDLHVSFPTTDDPCAAIGSDRTAYQTEIGVGTCSHTGKTVNSIQEIWYEYPVRTETNRTQIWKGATELSFEFLSGTAIDFQGDSTANGPEILKFDTSYMPFGQYLLTVVNHDEATLDSGAYDLGESGAEVVIYGPDNSDGTANRVLSMKVGHYLSGNLWRVMYIDNIFIPGSSTTWVHPFNMYQTTSTEGYNFVMYDGIPWAQIR